jgi:predicted 2-oxoglutarate/Fe(II)-dependent dioxygenase YbiX
MKTTFKQAAAVAVLASIAMTGFAPEAQAFRGRGAAFAVGAAVGSSGDAAAEANAAAATQQAAAATQQATAAQQQAEVEKQKAITAQKEAEAEKQKAIAAQQATGKPLPAGTVVAKLPSGCTPTPVGGKNYQYCGGTFYEPVYEGSTLKYVTATPK